MQRDRPAPVLDDELASACSPASRRELAGEFRDRLVVLPGEQPVEGDALRSVLLHDVQQRNNEFSTHPALSRIGRFREPIGMHAATTVAAAVGVDPVEG